MNFIDDARVSPFHRRLLLYANAGLFCDGYILSSIGLAIPSLTLRFHLDPLTTGWIGASTLLGILAGAVIFGPLTDRFGRRIIMMADLAVFALVSLLQAGVTDSLQLVILRFIIGVAIGADYPIAAALLSEFVPARGRGAALNSMQVTWFLGACSAYAVGNVLISQPDSWRWLLASAAVPALIGLAMRSSAPESVRWLAARGRVDEARAIALRYFGDVTVAPPARPIAAAALVRRPYRGALAFVATMWLLQVIPLFAIYTFAPSVLQSLHLGAGSPLGSLAITVAFLVGSLLATPLLDIVGRRAVCIAGFLVATLAFLALVVGPPALVVPVFVAYALGIGAAAGLELIYPCELFPTPIRASATGFAAGISRIGAFAGTFALPLALARYGVGAVMGTCAALSAVGLVVALAFAPETRGRTLDGENLA